MGNPHLPPLRISAIILLRVSVSLQSTAQNVPLPLASIKISGCRDYRQDGSEVDGVRDERREVRR